MATLLRRIDSRTSVRERRAVGGDRGLARVDDFPLELDTGRVQDTACRLRQLRTDAVAGDQGDSMGHAPILATLRVPRRPARRQGEPAASASEGRSGRDALIGRKLADRHRLADGRSVSRVVDLGRRPDRQQDLLAVGREGEAVSGACARRRTAGRCSRVRRRRHRPMVRPRSAEKRCHRAGSSGPRTEGASRPARNGPGSRPRRPRGGSGDPRRSQGRAHATSRPFGRRRRWARSSST